MRSLKTVFQKAVSGFLCALLLTGAALTASAAPAPVAPPSQKPVGEIQHVFLDRYQLTNEKIVPGSEFTLTLFLKNIGDKPADRVVVDVMYPIGVMPVYGTVSQAIVDVPADGTAEVEISYNALEKIGAPVLDFQVFLRENSQQSLTVLRTPVGLQSPFDVIATFVPARAMAGESVNCSMTFKYLGMETTDKVRARMNVNGVPVHTSEIGNLSRETTKTQSLFETFEAEGKYVVDLYLDYENESGEEKSVLVGTSLLEIVENHETTVSRPSNAGTQQENTDQSTPAFSSTHVLIISGSLILVIFVIIVLLVRKKK